MGGTGKAAGLGFIKNGLYFNSRLAIILRLSFVTNYPSDTVFQYPFTVTPKSPKMEQTKNLELEILLTLRSNKTVPTRKFHELFAQDWNLYRSKLNELIIEKFLKVSVQSPGICVFELSKKGDERMDELLRENAIEVESTTTGTRNFLKRFRPHQPAHKLICVQQCK